MSESDHARFSRPDFHFFFHDPSQVIRSHDFLLRHNGYTHRNKSLDISTYHKLACMLETALYERNWQLYYEGLILADRYGEAFQRNLASEKDEQDRRS
jgi:hypothetical protein